jgi:hypothetical protein
MSFIMMSIRSLQFSCEATSKSCTVKMGFRKRHSAAQRNERERPCMAVIIKVKMLNPERAIWIRYSMQFCFKITVL